MVRGRKTWKHPRHHADCYLRKIWVHATWDGRTDLGFPAFEKLAFEQGFLGLWEAWRAGGYRRGMAPSFAFDGGWMTFGEAIGRANLKRRV